MKIFITGSTGFVGSHLTDLLHASGHEIYSLARSEKKFKHFDVKGEMILGSLSHTGKHFWLDKLPNDLDAVIHIAGMIHTFNYDEFYNINAQATKNLINDLKGKYEKLKFIFISSQAAAGPSNNEGKIKEDYLESPVSHYGRSKLLAEKLIKESLPQNWNSIIIRPPMVIGPRDQMILEIFKMVKSGIIPINGLNGHKNQYSYVCVFDLINLIEKSLDYVCEENSDTFFSSYPETTTFEEIVNTIKTKMNKKYSIYLRVPKFVLKTASYGSLVLNKLFNIHLPLSPDKYQEIKQKAWLCSSKKSEEKLNMKYIWPLEKTIDATYKDYSERGWI